MPVGTTQGNNFVDKTIRGNLLAYNYKVYNKGQLLAQLGPELELFGTNTYIYSPTDSMASIAREFNHIHDEMLTQQFSPNR